MHQDQRWWNHVQMDAGKVDVGRKRQLSYSVSQVVMLTSLSRSTLYEAMARRDLAFVKYYGRRMILEEDLNRFLAKLRERSPS